MVGGTINASTGGLNFHPSIEYSKDSSKGIWLRWSAESYGTGSSNARATYLQVNREISSVWSNWNSCDGRDLSATANTIWGSWNDQFATTTNIRIYGGNPQATVERYREPSREQVAAAAVAAQERKRVRAAANGNAERLLRSVLNSEQIAMMERERKFHIIGQDGHRYEIVVGKQHDNIYRLNQRGERVDRFCIYQSGSTPMADNHVGQKLLIEADIELFKKIANRTAVRRAA